MLKKITKRDQEFGNKIKRLPPDWLDYNPFLILDNTGHGLADFWKFIIYSQQQDAARSLYFANSNQHLLVGHTVKRNAGKLVFSSQVLMKAYYLRYCILLLQACGDKVAQMVRIALDIRKWRIQKGKDIDEVQASEDNTTLTLLMKHMRLNECEPKQFYSSLKSYLQDDSVKIIVFQLANEIKHKWFTAYQGEGLTPIKNPISHEKDASGKLVKKISIGMSRGINIEAHIKHSLLVNNLFVQMAIRISELLKEDLTNKINRAK